MPLTSSLSSKSERTDALHHALRLCGTILRTPTRLSTALALVPQLFQYLRAGELPLLHTPSWEFRRSATLPPATFDVLILSESLLVPFIEVTGPK